MADDSRPLFIVPTHIQEREPFAFGRTVGEIAKLVAIGFLVARVVSSNDLARGVRWPAAAVLLLAGAAWALLRIQRRPLEWWLELLFRYGARPRRQVWKSSRTALGAGEIGVQEEGRHGWYELQRVRLRWAEPLVLNRPRSGQASGGEASSA
jgi:hypothetical protein